MNDEMLDSGLISPVAATKSGARELVAMVGVDDSGKWRVIQYWVGDDNAYPTGIIGIGDTREDAIHDACLESLKGADA